MKLSLCFPSKSFSFWLISKVSFSALTIAEKYPIKSYAGDSFSTTTSSTTSRTSLN